MGVEFLQKIGKTIKVARDKDRTALAQRDLFTRCIELAAQYELVRLAPGVTLAPGDDLNIELHDGRVVAVQGDHEVGAIDNPCQALRDMLAEYGVVGGRVEEIHPSARVAEIEIIE